MKLLLNIDVPEIATAEAFYTGAFGLVPGRRFGADGLELLGLEAPLYLLAKAEGTVAAGHCIAISPCRTWTQRSHAPSRRALCRKAPPATHPGAGSYSSPTRMATAGA